MKITASDGAMEEFAKAFDQYHDGIFRHCYFHLFDRERAKELMQETFMKTWEYVSDGKDVDNVQAFLYRVATNLIYNEGRKKKEASLDELQEAGYEPPDEDEAFSRDVIDEERVVKTLKKIEEPYRSAVAMRYIEGLAPAEIASITGDSANVVSVRIHRGLQQLRDRMNHG